MAAVLIILFASVLLTVWYFRPHWLGNAAGTGRPDWRERRHIDRTFRRAEKRMDVAKLEHEEGL